MIVAGGIGYRVTNDLVVEPLQVKRIRSFCCNTPPGGCAGPRAGGLRALACSSPNM